MCFSATASFALSSVLLPIGGWCVHKAWRSDRRYLPLALFPVAFGLQQAIEGMVWLGWGAHDPQLTCQAATGFVFFSHGFWLFWTPLMVSLLESRPRVRWLWRAMAAIGLAYGLYFLVPLLIHPDWLTVAVYNQTLDYDVPILIRHPFLEQMGQVLYIITILAPLLLVDHAAVQRLGGLVLVSLVTTTVLFPAGLISVWCFFAAVGSIYVGYIFLQQGETPSATPPIGEV